MITGSCFCAAITWQLNGRLQDGRACHCSRCRKAFSGASSAYAELTPGSRFQWITGKEKLVIHATGEEWGLGFCGVCGSTLCGIRRGEVHGVTLGCVEGDPGVAIEQHLFVGSKAPWDHIGGHAPQYLEHPPPRN
ncbi:MAG: GFA family protein [Pseudomonadales bacterium]